MGGKCSQRWLNARVIPSANESFLLCLGLVDFPTVARIGLVPPT